MIPELVSSDAKSRISINSFNNETKITVRTLLYEERENFLIELTIFASIEETVSKMRILLTDVRDTLLAREKPTSRLEFGNADVIFAPYNGIDLIKEVGKQWYECFMPNEPRLFFCLRFLLDVTVIDNFLESSRPN